MASDNGASDQARRGMNRRNLLRRAGMLGAGGGMVSLAGCSGGDDTTEPSDGNNGTGDDNDTDNDTGGDGEFVPADNAFTDQTVDDLTTFHFNHTNISTSFHHPMLFEYFQRYHIPTQEYQEWGVKFDEWAPEEERVVLKVMDGLTWHNGDPVTGEDLYTKLATMDLTGHGASNHFTEINVAGDRSLEMSLDGQMNRAIFQQSLNNLWIDTPQRMYGEFIEQWEDATTDDERNSIRSEMQNAEFEEPFGNGLFQIESMDDITTNRLRMTLYEDHPHADRINFDYFDLRRVSTDTASVVLGMVPDGPVDMVRNYTPPTAVLNQAQNKDGLLIQNLPALWGMSVPFNHNHEYMGNIRVRQALAEFIDRDLVARNYGQFGQPVEVPAGLIGNIAGDNSPSEAWKGWVSDEGAETLHRYQDPERGARLLRGEGFEKVDGTWMTPEGDPFEVPLSTPAGITDWNPVFSSVVSSWQENGINARLNMVDTTTYWGQEFGNVEYVAGSTGWTLQNPHPYYTNNQYWRVDPQYMNLQEELSDGIVEAPPFGEPDGDLQEWDVHGLMDELRVAREDEAAELIDQLSWVTNQFIPMLPLIEINDTLWMTDDDWSWPAKDDPVWQAKWPQWWLPRMGELQAKDEDDAM